jgi:ABC-type histidine transport system ATPase subunit
MRYREVIRTPLWLLAIIYFFFLSLVISIWAALGNNSALVSLVVLTLILVAVYVKAGLVIEVDDTEIRVGRAHLQRDFMGEITALDNQQLKRIRTRDADPAAFLAIRFWSRRAVQLFVNDTRDATPYWLISTSQPEKLLTALKALKS